MMIKQIVYILCTVLLLKGVILHAATDTANSGPQFTMAGVIDDIRLNDKVIVINDQIFEVASYAKVHAHKKYPNVFVLENLKTKMIVGVRLEAIRNNPSVITEVWLLDSLPQEEDDD